jgi:hypothetical protein
MNHKAREKALGNFRGVIRGWAFSNKPMLEGKIKAGEREAALLPDSLKGEAKITLDAMRDALRGF